MEEAKDRTILKVNDLRTYFYTDEGVVKAVDKLSYHVQKGESVGLVGESAWQERERDVGTSPYPIPARHHCWRRSHI